MEALKQGVSQAVVFPRIQLTVSFSDKNLSSKEILTNFYFKSQSYFVLSTYKILFGDLLGFLGQISP